MQHSHLGCTGCSSGHSPPYMLSSILHFSHNIKKRRKGSEELFIQPRSHPLSLCYISNMQTPLHSTRRESIILKKKRHALLKSKEIPCCRWTYSWLQHKKVFAFPPPSLIQISSPGLWSMRWAMWPCNDRILMCDWCTKSNAAASLSSVLLFTLDVYVTLLLILKAELTLGQQQWTQDLFGQLSKLLTASTENHMVQYLGGVNR